MQQQQKYLVLLHSLPDNQQRSSRSDVVVVWRDGEREKHDEFLPTAKNNDSSYLEGKKQTNDDVVCLCINL
jgi:hypothetical protein